MKGLITLKNGILCHYFVIPHDIDFRNVCDKISLTTIVIRGGYYES
jgi:hypothetical protein